MSELRVFREVREDEIETIAEIAVEAWTSIYDGYRRVMGDDLFHRLHRDWRKSKADQVRNAARNRPGMVWVTEIDGRIVGFTTFMVNEEARVGEIGNNAVAREFQGRGIGTQQHREVLRLLKERGLTHATVHTDLDDAHAPARASYLKVGFRPMSSAIIYFQEL